jgi:hypothetical protein
MDEILFNELLDSIKEAGKIKRGEVKPSRTFAYEENAAETKEDLNNLNFSKRVKQVEKSAQGPMTRKYSDKNISISVYNRTDYMIY